MMITGKGRGSGMVIRGDGGPDSFGACYSTRWMEDMIREGKAAKARNTVILHHCYKATATNLLK